MDIVRSIKELGLISSQIPDSKHKYGLVLVLVLVVDWDIYIKTYDIELVLFFCNRITPSFLNYAPGYKY